ncbi:hypothetical protein JB92DRAFT_1552850 [Gautieria morchelliformis]|nr:hypothetical protein JB92DRAFT_1552850 [Gautieria morchelliformis]
MSHGTGCTSDQLTSRDVVPTHIVHHSDSKSAEHTRTFFPRGIRIVDGLNFNRFANQLRGARAAGCVAAEASAQPAATFVTFYLNVVNDECRHEQCSRNTPKSNRWSEIYNIHFTPHGQLPKRRRRYDLRLRVGKDFEETASVLVKGPNAKVSWNDLIFDYVPHGSFGLRVDVYQHSALKSTQIFGTAANITPKALPDTCKLQGAEGGEGQITFTIASFATYTEVLDTLKEAGSRAKDVDSMEPAPSVLMPAWDHLVDTIHMFAEFVNKISEVIKPCQPF